MEDNVHFQSEVQYDLPIHKEFTKLTTECYGPNTFFRFLSVFCLFYFLNWLRDPYYRWLFLILCAVITIPRLFRLRKQRNGDLAFQQTLHRNDGKPPLQVVTLESEGVRSRNVIKNNEISDPYDQVTCLMESKNLLILMTKLKMLHLIDKRTLTGGSRDDAVLFLREQCPRLKKNIRTGRLYRISEYAMWGIIIVGIILSIAFMLHIPEKLSGQLTTDMSYEQMAEELARLDIVIDPATIEELEQYEEEVSDPLGFHYADYPKVLDLLSLEGMGKYDWDTWEWTPSQSGVYWFDMEVMTLDSIYTDFLTGIDAMDETLSFSNITEDYSRADIEGGSGDITFSFEYLGQRYELNARYNYDWFDTDMLYAVGRILAADESPKDLWMTTDGGQGLLLYYGTEDQMALLAKKTGLTFFDCVTMRMGH